MMLHTTWRIARAGLAAAVVVAVAGWAVERVRFGASDQDAVARIASELRQRFAASADSLGRIAARVVADRTLIAARATRPGAGRPPVRGGGRRAHREKREPDRHHGLRRARPRRSPGPAAPRICSRNGSTGRRRCSSSPARWARGWCASSRSSIATGPSRPPGHGRRRAAARRRYAARPAAPTRSSCRTRSFRCRFASGSATWRLRARTRSSFPRRAAARSSMPRSRRPISPRPGRAGEAARGRPSLSVVGITLLFCAGPLLALRRRARTTRTFVAASAGLVVAIVDARASCSGSRCRRFWAGRPLTSPLDLLAHRAGPDRHRLGDARQHRAVAAGRTASSPAGGDRRSGGLGRAGVRRRRHRGDGHRLDVRAGACSRSCRRPRSTSCSFRCCRCIRSTAPGSPSTSVWCCCTPA